MLLCGVPSMNWQVPQIAGKEKVKSPLAGTTFRGKTADGWFAGASTEGERELVSLF